MDQLKREQQLVSLKVMRLTKPELQHRMPLIADNRDVGFTVWPDADAGDQRMSHEVGGRSDADALSRIGPGSQCSVITHLTNNLSLPTSFGEVYLGQTFRCCICVSNISTEPDLGAGATVAGTAVELQNVELRVDMQLPTQRTVNAYDSVARGIRGRKVAPSESCEAVLIYEVKDLGMHTIVCCVNYTTGDNINDVQSFRKFFKFQSKKPIDVRTNSSNPLPNEYYLEATVQNLTNTPMYFERLEACQFDKAFFCEKIVQQVLDDEHYAGENDPLYESSDTGNSDPEKSEQINLLRDLDREVKNLENHHRTAVLAPNESKQYLFHFSCPSEDAYISMLRSSAPISPRLDIVWRASMGERGRLQTAPLLIKRGALTSVVARLVKYPGVVKMLSHFKIQLHLYSLLNITRPAVISDVILDFGHHSFQDFSTMGIIYTGFSNAVLQLSGQEPCRLTMDAVAIKPGTQKIPAFELVVQSTGERHIVDDLAQIYVEG